MVPKMDLLPVFVCAFLTFKLCRSEELLQTLQDTITAENYTYYRMFRPGRLRVELTSLSGDVDLYVSDETLKPTYNTYTAQSITCGVDVIEIPESYERPVGIGVFGHPNFEESKYKISIYRLDKSEEMDYEQLTHLYHDYEAADYVFRNYDPSDYMYKDAKPQIQTHSSKASNADTPIEHSGSLDDDEESAGSILWQILITLLKVVFEVIL